MLHFEQRAHAEGYQRVAGVDEAGRGPLAGPVVAAAVIFDPDFLQSEQDGLLQGLTDSKKLSETRREHFFALLTDSALVEIGVGQASVAEIDEINILTATHLAMRRALEAIDPPAAHALIDGRPVPDLPCSSTPIVRGDSKSLSIAAASVIAKVARDRIMVTLDAEFPQYGFKQHKGYGTSDHIAALRASGPSVHHRRSFQPVRELLEPHLFD